MYWCRPRPGQVKLLTERHISMGHIVGYIAGIQASRAFNTGEASLLHNCLPCARGHGRQHVFSVALRIQRGQLPIFFI